MCVSLPLKKMSDDTYSLVIIERVMRLFLLYSSQKRNLSDFIFIIYAVGSENRMHFISGKAVTKSEMMIH